MPGDPAPGIRGGPPGPAPALRHRGGGGFDGHLDRFGPLPRLDGHTLVGLLHPIGVRGRGGAGFPLARKLETVLAHRGPRPRRRPVVIVNAAEGEPASAKDSGLLGVAPHLVLDGAALAARAVGAHEVHVVTSEDRPWVGTAVSAATRQRRERGIRWVLHEAEARFVAGQSRAVLELIAGRPGLPVTSWAPEAVDGHRGRPTLLSNAESYAHVAAVVRWGPEEVCRARHTGGARHDAPHPDDASRRRRQVPRRAGRRGGARRRRLGGPRAGRPRRSPPRRRLPRVVDPPPGRP